MSFNLSDRVKNKAGHKGLIIRIVPQYDHVNKKPLKDHYMVEFDDTTLIPNRLSYLAIDIEVVTEDVVEEKPPAAPANVGIKCECGVDFVRHGGKHSDWCPKYKTNKYR